MRPTPSLFHRYGFAPWRTEVSTLGTAKQTAGAFHAAAFSPSCTMLVA
jgi:hypothetical protein